MRGYRKRPARITAFSPLGSSYRGVADSQLRVLENELSYSPSNIGDRWTYLPGGISIHSWVAAGMSGAEIFTPHDGEEGEEERFCYCDKCFAMGVVIGLSEGAQYNTEGVRFDVDVCREWLYQTFLSVPPTDFAEFQPGELVIVIEGPTEGVWPECCQAANCCMAKTVTLTSYYHQPMQKWIS